VDDTDDEGRSPFDTVQSPGRDLLQGIARESVRSRLFGEETSQLLGDRYRVLRRIGAGGMGAVYLAVDTRLERHVAIKVLHAGASDQERPRLVREALLMARVPSVHVVPVHDVGHDRGQAFVAMEYVPGPNLRQWWGQQKRSWREVLSVMIEAGRGLAAAHAAGVVHRDFKPDNVLIDADGRARVVDFGLASVGAIEIDPDAGPPTLSLDGSTLTTLTRTGELVGTPRYMAPEQFTATAPGEAADQFALCVTLYEGLYGQRPFEGDTMASLADSVMHGRVIEPPASSDVPGWLWPVVRRGLAPAPADRHASVAALLVALQRDPVSRRRRVVAGVGLLAVGGGVATAVWAFADREDNPACVLEEDRFAGVWDPSTRDAVRDAFDASGRAHASDTFVRVSGQLDAWVDAWRGQWTAACEAATRKEQSETVLDLRMTCLERSRVSLQAVTRLLRDPPDASVVDRAFDVVAALPRLERCAEVEALTAAYPPPESAEGRAEAESIADALASVTALRDAGAYEDSHAQLSPLLVRARELDHPPLLAEALLLDGSLRRSTESEAAAEPVLREAASVAARARADVIVSKAWLRLMAVARARGEYDKARELAGVAEIAIARAGSPAELVGSLGNERGILARLTADYVLAREQFEIARDRWAEVYGEDAADVAAATLNLGSVADDTGKVDEAAALYLQSLQMLEKALGDKHPRLSPALSRLGSLAQQRGRLDEARGYFERVLAIDTATHGAEHEEVAYTLVDLGNLAQHEQRCDDAAKLYDRARAIWTRVHGAEHPNLIAVDSNHANCLQKVGDYDAARAMHLRALGNAEKVLGADHPQVASILSNLGVVEEAQGRHADARGYHEKALALRKAKLGEAHWETINSVRNLAFVAAHEEKWSEARALYESALASLVSVWGREHVDVAVTHRELAKIAVATKRTADAKAHYEHAIAIYETLKRVEDAKELREELATLE
jgi:tetratricopeptide (TPR) repeat protein/predicted Ser/Thr protein kinase